MQCITGGEDEGGVVLTTLLLHRQKTDRETREFSISHIYTLITHHRATQQHSTQQSTVHNTVRFFWGVAFVVPFRSPAAACGLPPSRPVRSRGGTLPEGYLERVGPAPPRRRGPRTHTRRSALCDCVRDPASALSLLFIFLCVSLIFSSKKILFPARLSTAGSVHVTREDGVGA